MILTNYIIALENIGIIPILSKDVSKLDSSDALLLTGGGDIYPTFYGETATDYSNYDYLTDISEFYLLKRALYSKKRIVGICKGMQVINVFFNGTIENLNSSNIKNHYTFSKDLYHEIITKDGNKFLVNSMHKQRIRALGKDLTVLASSNDGTIEAIKSDKYNLLGVQFHPERMNANSSLKFYEYAFNN